MNNRNTTYVIEFRISWGDLIYDIGYWLNGEFRLFKSIRNNEEKAIELCSRLNGGI